ncbi:glycosyltransferase [Sphingomonas abietis]|uniref:Glycosyltransferase n=1 Tax=Sphingomonas abietis TaxID=3012344 RepID=A0ABY7NNR7_9SPHN|nr:glycosyltransferase [Sphingomonas abietis]WBO23179.1 glycosyltransferase [Sphingomonas abietis]
MRIVDVCAFYAPRGGGVKTYVDRKLAAGARHGHEIVVIAPGEQRATEVRGPGARIEWLPAPKMPFDRNYRYFPDQESIHAALDRLRPDMVEASSPWRAAEAVASWRGSAPRALFMHADPLAAYAYRWFGPVAKRETIDRGFDWFWRHLRRLDARFDLVVSPSRSLADRLTDGGLRQVVTHPLGIASGEFGPEHRDPALRAALLRRCGLGPEATLLLGLGRHAPEKRWPMVVDACMAAGVERPVGLVLVGDGRERAKILRHVGENPHVLLLAPVTDRPALAQLLASADALIHGCEAETFCLVAAEARAAGLPLIAPDRGGAADQARESGGEVYRAADAGSAAQAVLRLIERGVDTLGAEARARAGGVRTLDRHFADLFAAYRGLGAGMVRAA